MSNSTVYVRNLHERIKPQELKDALEEIFSEYGNVIDVVAKRNLKAKGQAFVVFDNVDNARRAIEEIQGFELFEKPMALDFARTKSDATVRAEATAEDFELHKRKRMAEKERRQAAEATEMVKKLKRPAAGPEPTTIKSIKSSRGAGLKLSNPSGAAVIPEEYLPPNKILFVQNLPDEYDMESLSSLFAKFDGFKEVRLVPGRKGIAFVEYDAEAGAISAKENMAGMSLGEAGNPIKVVYQRQ